MDITAINENDKRVLNGISGRLSLRSPQRESLEALATAIDATNSELINPKHDVPSLLSALQSAFPKLENFERDFPSLCFALATGVGKTRLMLHIANAGNPYFRFGSNDIFVPTSE